MISYCPENEKKKHLEGLVIISIREKWRMKLKILSYCTINNTGFSSKCKIIQTFKAQKMQASPRQKWAESCLKLLLKISSCQSTCEGLTATHFKILKFTDTNWFKFQEFRELKIKEKSLTTDLNAFGDIKMLLVLPNPLKKWTLCSFSQLLVILSSLFWSMWLNPSIPQ